MMQNVDTILVMSVDDRRVTRKKKQIRKLSVASTPQPKNTKKKRQIQRQNKQRAKMSKH